MDVLTNNTCAICGAEIEPEEEFCRECLSEKEFVRCPICGKIVCECETGDGD